MSGKCQFIFLFCKKNVESFVQFLQDKTENNLRVPYYLLLSSQSAVILRLLQLAALLRDLLVLLVELLPLGLHLPQLGGETAQLLALVSLQSLRPVDHLQLLAAVVLGLLAQRGGLHLGRARLGLQPGLECGLEVGQLGDLLSQLGQLLVSANCLSALGDAAQLLEYPALYELLLVEELLREILKYDISSQLEISEYYES